MKGWSLLSACENLCKSVSRAVKRKERKGGGGGGGGGTGERGEMEERGTTQEKEKEGERTLCLISHNLFH